MMPPETHAAISPSRLQRILDCPGSFQLARKYEGEDKQSSYAAEGSLLHLATETWLIRHIKSYASLPDKCNMLANACLNAEVESDIVSPTLDKEQCSAVEDCLNYLGRILQTCDEYEILIEQRVGLKNFFSILIDVEGTCDVLIKTKTQLHAVDWKFGKGVAVYVKDNDQLYAYLAGAAYDMETLESYTLVSAHVVQPRLENYDVVDMYPDELGSWVTSRVLPGVTRAYEKHAPYQPGIKQCRWCPAKAGCRARFNVANQTASDIFASSEKLSGTVSIEEMSALLAKAPVLEDYIKDMRNHIATQIQNGTDVPGFKMVKGRSIRKWDDISKAEKWLNQNADQFGIAFDDIYESKFVSPAKAEKLSKLMKKLDAFQELIVKPEGKPSMVPEGDKRAAIEYRTAEQKFKEALSPEDAVPFEGGQD